MRNSIFTFGISLFNLIASYTNRFVICLFVLILFSATDSYSQITVSGSNSNGNYATLTGTSGAFAALNSVSQVNKNILVTITSDPVEPASGNVALTGAAGMWSTLVISPSGARTVSGSVSGAPLINLSGAQIVTIDGLNTGGNSLTISNPATSLNGTCTIQFINDAMFDTIKNCTILGSPPNYDYNNETAIVYFNTASSIGNSNNTVTQCNIGPASNTVADFEAILSNGNSDFPNSSNTISFNNIYSFSTYGIALYDGTGTGWNISNNSFYKTPAFTYNGNSPPGDWPENAIYISSSGAAGFTISGNYIGGTSPNGGTPNNPWDLGLGDGNGFQAISLTTMSGSGPATNILNNKIQNFISEATEEDWTFDGIYINEGIVNIGDGTTANQNVIGNVSPSLGVNLANTFYVATVAGIYIDGQHQDCTVNINNNLITNVAYTGAQNLNVQLYGIYYDATATITVNDCKIYNLSNNCTYNGGNDNPVLAGIYNWGSATPTAVITGNEIYNLTTSSSAVTEPVYGISLNTASTNPPAGLITGNFIHNIVNGSSDVSTAITAGIDIEGGSYKFYNNIIQLGIDTSGNSITTGYGIYGINYAGADNYGNLFYHNSIYIGGSGVASSANTFCFYRAAAPYNAQLADTIEDNIFFNDRLNASGSAYNYAIADNGVNTHLVSNYNDIYTLTANVASKVAGSATPTTFAGWQGLGHDVNSVNSDPKFLNPVGAPPDFHLTTGTPCDHAGILIPYIITDYFGSIRANYTPVDLGAVVFKPGGGSAPVARFSSSDTTFCAYTCISFTDLSSNIPTGWQWSFQGGNPSFSTDTNPQVCYTDSGRFDVTLIASNADGADTLYMPEFISVKVNPPPPVVTQSHDTLFSSTDSVYISYQWYNSTAIIAGATDTFLVINNSADYVVDVTNKFGCKTATGSNIILGTETYGNQGIFALYPNPATNQITIHNPIPDAIETVSVLNMLGQVLQTEEVNEKDDIVISVSDLPAGIYFLKATSKSGKWVGQFVKE